MNANGVRISRSIGIKSSHVELIDKSRARRRSAPEVLSASLAGKALAIVFGKLTHAR